MMPKATLLAVLRFTPLSAPLPGWTRYGGPLLSLSTLGGCASGAPSYPIVGAFFPGWMFCGMIGIATAVALRVLFVLTGIDAILSFRLVTYVALGTVAASLVWLLVFGP